MGGLLLGEGRRYRQELGPRLCGGGASAHHVQRRGCPPRTSLSAEDVARRQASRGHRFWEKASCLFWEGAGVA